MGIFDNIKDHFNNAEFSVAPNMKLKSISRDFVHNFDLALIFYKGNQIADGNLTLKGLDRKTTKDVDTRKYEDLKIKGSMKVGDVEQLFDTFFGIKVQVKDKEGKRLVPNAITLGQAARGEY